MGDPSSSKHRALKDSQPPPPYKGDLKKSSRLSKNEDAISTITSDTLAIFRKKYHFPNELIIMPPRKSDRVRSPPSGYFSIYEMHLRAGLRFPLIPELTALLSICEICISQLSCRAMTIIMGLIVFFRNRDVSLNPDCFVRLGRLLSDAQGRITCRSKLLDFHTKDAGKNWPERFFYVKNEWGALEKWGKLRDLSPSLHVTEENVLQILKIKSIEDLQYELCHINDFVTEDILFKVGISIQAGRSYAIMLKKTEKPRETKDAPKASPILIEDKNEESPLKRKRKVDENFIDDDPLMKIHIPEEILNHSCTHSQRMEALQMKQNEFDREKDIIKKEWNSEYVKIKYLYSEYKRRYQINAKKNLSLDNQLTECRTELSNMATSLSLQRQDLDRTRDELIEARTDAKDAEKNIKSLESKVISLEKDLQTHKTEKQTAVSEAGVEAGLKAVEDFKKSIAFKSIIKDHVRRARDHIFDVEVKSLERQCIEEGFIRGFLKGTRLVNRKTGANIEGLSPSQASEDPLAEFEDDAESVSPLDDDSNDDVDV